MSELDPSSAMAARSEAPWPDLRGFFEGDDRFFKGRDHEKFEIASLIRSERVCVLYGKSGMGKSSLLRAGIFPILRQARFIPVYIRLNHDERALSLEEQVEQHLKDVIRKVDIDAPEPVREQTLWEYFHRKDVIWWTRDHKIATPVMVFDQFEEVLTSGQSSELRQSRTHSFLVELEDCVENRVPDRLREQFDANSDLAEQYEFSRADFRVVLCLREDFLPELESLRSRLRGVMTNRFRLLPLDGEQALKVVTEPLPGVVDNATAIEIVDRASRSSVRAATAETVTFSAIAKRWVEPALLCLLCRELNRERLTRSQNTITADLVRESHEAVIHSFYERAMKKVSPQVRIFVEERLITESGLRGKYAKEDAIVRDRISESEIDALVDEHLLRRELSNDVIWLELTHDRLADVALSSRNERRKEAETANELAKATLREQRALEALTRSRKTAMRRLLLVICFAIVGVSVAFIISRDRIAKAERDKATAERDKATAESDKAKAERDRAKAESDKAKAERDKATAEASLARKEAEQLAEQDKLNRQQMASVSRQAEDTRRIIDRFVQKLAGSNATEPDPTAAAKEDSNIDSAQSIALTTVSDAVLETVKDDASNIANLTREQVLLLASAGLLDVKTGIAKSAKDLLIRANGPLEAIVRASPDDADSCLKRYEVLTALGDLERARLKPGDKPAAGAAAADYYSQALEFAESQVSRLVPPLRAIWQLRVATTTDRIGDIARVTGNLEKSRDLYRKAIDIRAAIELNGELKERILLGTIQSLNKLGNSYCNSDPRKALTFYESALSQFLAQKENNQTDPDVLRLKAILEDNIGTMYRDLKNYAAMQDHFSAAIGIYETLYAEHPENTLWRDCLAEGSNEIASYYIFEVPESLKRRDLALYYAFRAVSLSGERNAKYLSTLKSALNSVGQNHMRALATKVDSEIKIQKERATVQRRNQ